MYFILFDFDVDLAERLSWMSAINYTFAFCCLLASVTFYFHLLEGWKLGGAFIINMVMIK